MWPYFSQEFGNAASRQHAFGWAAAEAVERARGEVARLIGARPHEIVFTSGATEANNLAIKGVAAAAPPDRRHVVTSVIEHRAVLDVCRRLEAEGYAVTCVPVGPDGVVDPDEVARAITSRTILVSIMAANNEIGTVQPVAEIGRIARERGVLVHTDAAQAAGHVPFDVDTLGVDLASLSAHKLYGPKGIGALFVRREARRAVRPILDGGGHERGLRSGTLNVPAIVGFGRAALLALEAMPTESARLARLRDRLLEGLQHALDGVRLNGAREPRLPHNLNVSFAGIDGEALFRALDDIAVSSGAACASATAEPSHVLRALGVPDDLARATVRFGLGRFTTEAEIEYAIERIATLVNSLRHRPLEEAIEAPAELPEGWRV